MKVKFQTNLDKYESSYFPSNLEIPPRIGEKVEVCSCVIEFLQIQKLPTRLEVRDVTYNGFGAVVELHYNETDLKIALANDAGVY